MENEILLVGLGLNRYKLNEITEFQSIEEIKERLKEQSCFYSAATEAFSLGAKKLYILNLEDWEDVKEQQSILEDLNFDYIVPLNLYIDDIYYDREYEKNLTYSQLFLYILDKTMSTIILTGKHASSFETLDDYLEDENNRLKESVFRFNNLRDEGIIYVSNILNQISFANVALAVTLSKTEYGEYPVASNLSVNNYPVFDIYYSDISNRLVYFSNSVLTGLTLENLVNFSNSHILRLIPVYKILKYFYYNRPNMDEFIGKAFTEYRKLKIKERLQNYLNDLVGTLIYSYEILSITAVSSEHGTVDILLRYSIYPKFTTEKYIIETSL